MSDILNACIYFIGAAVCVIGSVGILAMLAVWAINKVAFATKTTWIIARWWADTRRSKHPG